MSRRDPSSPSALVRNRPLMIVRGLHTVIYAALASSTLMLLYIGLTGRHWVWLWVALPLMALEVAVYAGSGLRCPLTAVVDRYAGGARRSSDTFMPERLTRHTLKVFGPLLGIALLLLAGRWAGVIDGGR